MDAFKIAALGVMTALSALLLRKTQPYFAVVLGIGGGMLIFGCILNRMGILILHLQGLFSVFENGGHYLGILLKASGITMISEFAAGICKDSQMASVGELIRIFAKISLFLMGIPILTAVVTMIGGLVN